MLITKINKFIFLFILLILSRNSVIFCADNGDGYTKTQIETQLKELQQRLNGLNADIDKIQESVISAMKLKNLISISFKNNISNLYLPRNVLLYLDNQVVFEARDELGIWRSYEEVPLLFGPLIPGEHKAKIVITMGVSEESIFAQDEYAQKKVENEFSVIVPEVDVKINYIIALGGSDERDGVVNLTVEKISLP